MPDTTCHHCGAVIEAKRTTRRYCSAACRQAAWSGRWKTLGRTCAWCTEPIPPRRRSDARFCDHWCKESANNHIATLAAGFFREQYGDDLRFIQEQMREEGVSLKQAFMATVIDEAGRQADVEAGAPLAGVFWDIMAAESQSPEPL